MQHPESFLPRNQPCKKKCVFVALCEIQIDSFIIEILSKERQKASPRVSYLFFSRKEVGKYIFLPMSVVVIVIVILKTNT